MTLQIWLLPIAILVVTTILALPLGRYLAWIMNGHYKAPRFFHWFETRLDSGPQNWKQYTVSVCCSIRCCSYLASPSSRFSPGCR